MRTEQNRTEQNRTEQIDVLKAICAFMVVYIHAPYPGPTGAYIISLFRFAVPIFFIITGFYYSKIINKGKRLYQIRKIFLIAVKSNFIFLCWKFIIAFVKGKQYLKLFFADIFSINSILNFILFNENEIGPHLWYLNAVLYVLLIAWLVDEFKARKLIIYIIPFLLLGDLLLGKYSLILFGREFPYYYVRNFLFVGIPYFYIGIYIYTFRTKILHTKSRWLICAITFFSITTICERFFLIHVGKNAVRDHYFSTTFLSIFVFVYALSKEKYKDISKKSHWILLSKIGKDYSTDIYILHPLFLSIFQIMVGVVGLEAIWAFFAPIIIYIVTALYSVIAKNLKCRLFN